MIHALSMASIQLVNFIDSASAWDEENKRLTVFVINRNEDAEYPLTVDLKGFAGYEPAKAFCMHTDDLEVKNSYEDENALRPESVGGATFENGEYKVYVKPLSWNVYVFEG